MESQKMKWQIENYINELERSIREPIIDRDVGKRTIDPSKVFFLLLPLLNGENWTPHIHTAAIAVGAVQAAFDAHDAIDSADATSTAQQLTVLAGDHYSGIHYRLLASLPEFDFIRSLSRTIGHINETKTACHEQFPDEPASLIEAIRCIEAGCIVDFLHTFGFSRYASIAEAALPILRMDSVGVMNDGTERGVFSSGRDLAVSILSNQLRETIDDAHFLEPFLRKEIRDLATPLSGKLI